MSKMLLMLREFRILIRQHRLYFLAPVLIMFAVLALLFFKVGPGILITFIYAGV